MFLSQPGTVGRTVEYTVQFIAAIEAFGQSGNAVDSYLMKYHVR